MNNTRRPGLNQRAFTIIELMIATAVLSTILLLVTTMMISIGNLYYKGVNQARIQDDVRGITDEVAQHLQLSSQGPQAAAAPIDISISGQSYVINAYCIDNTRYSYIENVQIGTAPTATNPQIPHVLWRDQTPAAGCTTPADLSLSQPTVGGTELMAPESRLTDFTITGSSPYTVSVSAAYGSDDLLNPNGINTTCKGSLGDQFCSTASLTTTVVQRATGDGS